MIGRDDKDPGQRRLRVLARELLSEGKVKHSKALNHRAINISRPPSQTAQKKKTAQPENATSWKAEGADLGRQYRRLLTDDESIENFDISTRLIEDVIGVRIEWQHRQLALQRLRWEGEPNFELFFARLGHAVQQFQTHGVAEAVEGRRCPEAHFEQRARVVKAAFAMSMFPDLIEQLPSTFTNDRGSFVLDACMLLFHQAYFALMPTLEASRWEAERLLLLEAFRSLAHHVSRCSDALRVLALYYDAFDKEDIAILYYVDAISATHSNSHEFMSVIQAAWAFWIERHCYREALDILLNMNTRILPSDMLELQDMGMLTVDLMRSRYRSRERLAG